MLSLEEEHSVQLAEDDEMQKRLAPAYRFAIMLVDQRGICARHEIARPRPVSFGTSAA